MTEFWKCNICGAVGNTEMGCPHHLSMRDELAKLYLEYLEEQGFDLEDEGSFEVDFTSFMNWVVKQA